MPASRVTGGSRVSEGRSIERREFLAGLIGSAAALALHGRLPGMESQGREEPEEERPMGGGTGKTKPTGYLWDEIYLKHDTGGYHPESARRLTAINERLKGNAWFKSLLPLKAAEAPVETVALVHPVEYIEKARKECEEGRGTLSTGDTNICRDSYRVALAAVGGVTAAVDAIMEGKAKNAFCAVRPPGHHACPSRGMGFCIFNNVAIAARYAQKKHSVERVLIADWDVHHGNGTQEIFYSDGSVFFMSTHQWPLYPNTGRREETGEGKGKGLIMNRPFPAGAGGREIIGAFRDDLLPEMKKFKPDLVIVSAGFDSREGDPLGRFKLTDDDFRELTKIVLEIAGIAGKGRVISALEGGYSLGGLASAVSAHVEELSKA
ncbi:MAG: histone deacetylase [Planctomycetota bacterium]|nr:histone deacetylase [Planctomycetota bacterium]